MVSKIKIVRVKDYIHLLPTGTMNLLKFKDCIQDLSTTHGLFTDFDLLIDTRGAETHLGVNEIWELAKELAEVIHSGSGKGFRAKIAVICPTSEFDNAKFFELCASNRGLNVGAFNSFEDLFDWISESSPIEKD